MLAGLAKVMLTPSLQKHGVARKMQSLRGHLIKIKKYMNKRLQVQSSRSHGYIIISRALWAL